MSVIKKARGAAAALLAAAVLAAGGAGGLAQSFTPISASANGYYRVAGKSLSGCKAKLGATKFKYTGKAIRPTITVTDGAKKLTYGTDYTLTYSNNVKVGTGKVTVKGKGSYSGSKNAELHHNTEIGKEPERKGGRNEHKAELEKVHTSSGYKIYRLDPATKKSTRESKT